MLRRDVVDLLNDGDAWAFVGSGVSAEAGGPTWQQLLDRVMGQVETGHRQSLEGNKHFASAVSKSDFASAFGRIEQVIGRLKLEELVRAEVTESALRPGPLAKLLTDLPFKGYITTNYDAVLEDALSTQGHHGWVPIGNRPNEVPKVSGGATHVVWHIHGCATLTETESHLVITNKDYDALYLEETDLTHQLRGLLTHRRIVFVGFGFQDPEFLRILRKVGRLANPARPAIAFLSNRDVEDSTLRRELRESYNVEVVSYRVQDDSHAELLELTKAYASMTLRRSLKFQNERRTVPSYDAETTGLLLYNELVLKGTGIVAEEVLANLADARVLSLVRHQGRQPVSALVDDLSTRIQLLLGGPDGARAEQIVRAALGRLRNLGLILISGDELVSLTDAGMALLREKAAASELLASQFGASLQSRAKGYVPEAERAIEVAAVAEAFLKHCIDTRSLGIAMAAAAGTGQTRQFQIVGVLQALPEFMSGLASPSEAIALSKLVQDVLAAPTELERRFIGLALQARFGVHLLGYDLGALSVRVGELVETCFLIDANNLITFLARSSPGHDAAVFLMERLAEFGSACSTTPMLAEEVAEHARWAVKRVSAGGQLTVATLEAASGRAGQRSNAFLDGLLDEVDSGQRTPDLLDYLTEVLGVSRGKVVTRKDVGAALEALGVPCRSIDEWSGFDEVHWAEIEELSQEIAKKRRGHGTFRHGRQVRAEAEVVVTIKHVREHVLEAEGSPCKNSFFISNTRVLDDLTDHGPAFTMKPDLLLHWMATLRPISEDEIEVFTSSLLGEMAESGISLIDEKKIQRIFSPLISAGREEIEGELEKHRTLVATRFGEDSVQAFQDVSELDAPIVAISLHKQRADYLQEALAKEQDAREVTEKRARMADADRAELERLRGKQSEKARKAQARKRKSQSKPKKKKRGD